MTNDNDLLRAAAAKPADCLSDAAIERLAHSSATPAESAHAASCAFCQAEVELLQSFLSSEPTAAEAVAVRHIEKQLQSAPAWRTEAAPATKKWWFARPVWGGALAALAAAVALVVFTNNPTPAPNIDNLRSGQIESLSPTGDLTSPPQSLQWRAVPGAVSYEVRLTDITEQTLWQTSVPAPTVTLPAQATGLMTERKTLTWRIRALDNQGKTVAVSAPETFRIVSK